MGLQVEMGLQMQMELQIQMGLQVQTYNIISKAYYKLLHI
jgi:hypothetical protein